jgi:hypothetical protein
MAHTGISSCDLGAMSQQTDKYITAAVVHHMQVEASSSLDLDQAFCHIYYSNFPRSPLPVKVQDSYSQP